MIRGTPEDTLRKGQLWKPAKGLEQEAVKHASSSFSQFLLGFELEDGRVPTVWLLTETSRRVLQPYRVLRKSTVGYDVCVFGPSLVRCPLLVPQVRFSSA